MATTYEPSQDALDAFDTTLAEDGLEGHWKLGNSLTSEPGLNGPPYIWKWEKVYRHLLRAGEMMGMEGGASRRTLRLCTPGLAQKFTTPTFQTSIQLVKPGVGTDQIAAVWPKAQDFGFENEMEAFALQFGHGLGVGLHERPIISRLISFDDPKEIKEGMVFALETYCPASDGYSAARIEEEVVVTNDGCRIITLFPADELPISNRY